MDENALLLAADAEKKNYILLKFLMNKIKKDNHNKWSCDPGARKDAC